MNTKKTPEKTHNEFKNRRKLTYKYNTCKNIIEVGHDLHEESRGNTEYERRL